MEIHRHPDPFVAARHLTQANIALREAFMALGGYSGSEVLQELASALGKVAEEFAAGRLLAGLKIELISARAGARAMGRANTPKKLEALAKARAILAERRKLRPQIPWKRRRKRRRR